MPYLSLCMIVKNEERVLGRCLDSVKGIVDEIIIADTGSTDDTVKIASEYTEHIYNFDWTDSFSDARNFVQEKSSCKWILVLDADEYVDRDNLIDIKEKLVQTGDNIEALVATIYNFTGNNGEHIVQHRSLRIYKNDPSIKYTRAIHEQLVKDNTRECNSEKSELIIYHSGYLDKVIKNKDKNTRNKKLIEKQTEQSGQIAFDYFNMGNELMVSNEVEKALESYRKAYIEKADIRFGWVSMTVVQMVLCLTELKRYTEALAVIEDSEKIWNEAPEFKCFKANIYLIQNRIDDAKEELLSLVNNKGRYQSYIKSIDYLEFHPYMQLGGIYEFEGNTSKAIESYAHILSNNKRSNDAFYKLITLLIKHCSHEEIIKFINDQGLSDNKNIVRLIKVLLDNSQVELSEKYIKQLDEGIKIKDGILFKLNLVKNEFSTLVNKLKEISIEELQRNISEGFIDHIDILLLYLLEKDSNYLIKIEKLFGQSSIVFLQDLQIRNEEDKNLYLFILDRCLKYRYFDLFESMLQHKAYIDGSVELQIGHLLCKYRFNDLALDFYEKVGDVKLLDETAFINIIDSFIKTNSKENAVQFALQAIEFGYKDFRIFKYAIGILRDLGMEEIRTEIIQLAQKSYPDSNWLKKIR